MKKKERVFFVRMPMVTGKYIESVKRKREKTEGRTTYSRVIIDMILRYKSSNDNS